MQCARARVVLAVGGFVAQVCCGVLRCVEVCCSVLQCVAVCYSESRVGCGRLCGRGVLRCVTVCCSVLRCVAVCCGVLQCVLQCVAVCCSVLQCVALCCSAKLRLRAEGHHIVTPYTHLE